MRGVCPGVKPHSGAGGGGGRPAASVWAGFLYRFQLWSHPALVCPPLGTSVQIRTNPRVACGGMRAVTSTQVGYSASLYP